MSRISIALCTFNGEKYLQEQLDSYLYQTCLPNEVVVCDDASTDSTLEIVQRFASAAPFPVRVFANKENIGLVKNFEQAITNCTGDIIFLSDQDDVWQSNKLERMLEVFESRSGIGLVSTDAELVDEDGARLGIRMWEKTFPEAKRQSFADGNEFEIILRQNVLCGATTAFRSDLRVKILPIPSGPLVIHDWWIALIGSIYGKIALVDESLINYRQHPNQQIGVLSRRNEGSPRSRLENCKEAVNSLGIRLDEYSKLLARLDELAKCSPESARISSARATIINSISDTRSAIGHFTNRLDLPAARLKRIGKIISEVLTGRYQRFSNGTKSIARDLLEP